MRHHSQSNPLRKILLVPLALLYAGATALHRRVWLRPITPPPSLPLIVIGSLRAGGAGKTSVTLELARRLTAQGKRVGILVYRIRGRREVEVAKDSDWRDSSDEAVLLARRSGARVFATRDRAATWRRLARTTPEIDILLSDDGLMDRRLAGARRIALVRPGENPGLFDLLPAGPYRRTARVLSQVDAILWGPIPGPDSPSEKAEPDFRFYRSVLPITNRPVWLLCGLANPDAVRGDLERAGAMVAGVTAGPNHGLPDVAAARRHALAAAAAGLVYTAKDAIKLDGLLQAADHPLEIQETLSFSPAFLSAFDAFTAPPTS